MAQDQLDLTPQDTLALSAAMRRPLTDLFTRIRAIAAHEEMLTPYLRQELEVLLRHISGESYQQIAMALDRPEKSVDNALQRIKNKLASFR